ncbi:MAG: hypothetical protein EBQ64_08870, partial [Acidimicrobiia bacterium]|nr:hypothetical protein [Acidimicrobiia bacterium]
MKMFLLQSMSLPRAETTEPLLYVRTLGEVQVSDTSTILHAGAELSFDTSFGVFAAGRWRRLTTIKNLSAAVFATGSGRIEIIGVETRFFGTKFAEKIVASTGIATSGKTIVEVPNFTDEKYGSFYVRVSAEQTDVVISRAEWTTTTDVAREIKLS